MSRSLMRVVLDAIMPKGSVWIPKPDGDFDHLLSGIADSFDDVKKTLVSLNSIRNPEKTEILDELELDYGVLTNSSLTEQQRRDSLGSRVNIQNGTGSRQEVEEALQSAGFDVNVYANDPAIDPKNLQNDYIMVAGGFNAFAGSETAFAGAFEAELVVNGDIIITTSVAIMFAGGNAAFAGGNAALAGVSRVRETEYKYFISSDPKSWPFYFFVGGDAQFADDGSIITIEYVDIDDDRRLEFREIILRYKPLYTWALLQVNFV